MRVAVTGGSGQLGTRILRRLLDDRAVKGVVSLDKRPPLLVGPKLRAELVDIRDKDLARHFEGCDALLHLAFVVVAHLPRPVFDDINIEGSKNVFAAAAAAGVKTVVYASSIAAYGASPEHPAVLSEDAPRFYQESFPYAAAKYKVEEFLDAFEPAHPDIAISRLRPTILIGADMEHALGAMLGRRLLVSHSAARLPIVWDEDVADAAISAMKRRARGAFNLSASEPLPMEGLARAAGMRYARVPKRLVYALSDLRVQLAARGLVRSAEDPSWVRSGEAPAVFSTERARRELGWSPRCETAADVVRRYAEVVPSRPDPRVALFMRAVDLAGALGPEVPELAGLAARVRLELTGRGGGVFGLIVEGNRARVRAGAPRAPTAALTLKTSLFLDLLAGRADFTTAQVTGQLRVEGEVLNAMLLGGMITMFRAGAERKGLRGALVRRAGAWFAQGVG